MSNTPIKKSRKKTGASVETGSILTDTPINNNIQMVIEEPPADVKKRGRKPKGGKLIAKVSGDTDISPPVANVILHLKCSTKDLLQRQPTLFISNPLDYNATAPPEIMTYDNIDSAHFSNYNNTTQPETIAYNKTGRLNSTIDATVHENTDTTNIREINMKLKQLKLDLYKNSMNEKKSACFWCTYDFDNPPCFIPKYEMDGEICGYGSFCRPECAVGYLMKENLDDSTKFERYHLLNRIYSKVYDFTNNIKPAPNPYYLLDKFYGNLSIQEYRKLLNSGHMLLVVDKPLTRILPELHEDTDDFVAGVYGGSKGNATQAGGVYKVKRQGEKQKGASKAEIMREQFGIAA